MARERIKFLSVPVDVIPRGELENEIAELLQSGKLSQICFVTIWDILKARMSSELLSCLNNASLVIPVSKSILRGASFLGLSVPVRYNPFSAIISILDTIDKHHRSLYMFGSRKDCLMTAERNVRETFSNIQIVGRYVGYYPKSAEKNIIQAIHKAAPSLLLVSDGIRGGQLWSFSRRHQLPSGLILHYRDIFPIFSKHKKRVSPERFEKGLEIWGEILRNPLKILLVFPYIWYIIVLVWYKCFKKADNSNTQ